MVYRNRRAFTLVELLAVIAIIGILFALLLPAVQSALEAARQVSCSNNLRQMALAVQAYEGINGVLPAGRDGTLRRDHSWATAVLPHLELQVLYDRYRFDRAWNAWGEDFDNLSVAATSLSIFLCPTTYHEWPGATDYGGNYGSSLSGLPRGYGFGRAWESGVMVAINPRAMYPPRSSQITSSQVRDGASQTIMVMEDSGRGPLNGGQWANGHQCFAHEYQRVNEDRRSGIFSDHPGGASVVMVDASVHFLSNGTSTKVLGAVSTRAQGELIREGFP